MRRCRASLRDGQEPRSLRIAAFPLIEATAGPRD